MVNEEGYDSLMYFWLEYLKIILVLLVVIRISRYLSIYCFKKGFFFLYDFGYAEHDYVVDLMLRCSWKEL